MASAGPDDPRGAAAPGAATSRGAHGTTATSGAAHGSAATSGAATPPAAHGAPLTSDAINPPAPQGIRASSVVAPRMILYVWLPVVAIGGMHYALGASHHWGHDVLRRAYYLPIVVAAFLAGLRGGLGAALVVSITYLPHAFLLKHNPDPAPGLEKFLEIVLYFGVGGVAGYLADLEATRRRQLQAAYDHLEAALAEHRRMTQQLARAGRLSALGELVAGIAHEIKNPLHALAGTAEVIDPLVASDAPERRLWELHVGEIERIRRIAERFLSFARPRPPERIDLDLRDVGDRVYRLVGAEARQKNVSLTLETPEAPLPIRGDQDQLAQVVMNIVINGLRAMEPEGGHMRITVGRADAPLQDRCFLRIENDGPPIPEALLEQIFDPFHSTDAESTGLGLAISSRIMEQHDGYIEAANQGLGVCFTINLPLA